MESAQAVDVIIILGTSAVALFALVTIVILIIYKRKIHIKDLMIQHYQQDCKKEIEELRQEMQKEIDALKQTR